MDKNQRIVEFVKSKFLKITIIQCINNAMKNNIKINIKITFMRLI